MEHIVIIGGGVIGLSIARHLADAHCEVSIIDRSTPRMNASYAAGGMLGAQNEFFEESPLYRLAMKSRALMPNTAYRLHQETGIDIEFQSYGLIKLATETRHVNALRAQYTFLKQDDHRLHWYNNHALQQHFPQLNPETTAAFKIHDDGQVNAHLYTKALTQAVALQKNTTLHLNTEVLDITQHVEGGYTLNTSACHIHANILVVAAGAWSGQLLQSLNVDLPTRPVKGDVKLIQASRPILNTTLFNMNGCYIVPKKTNRYLIGATSEVDNWSTQNHPDNLKWLDAKSQAMLPQLRHEQTLKTWTGIRPITEDGWPVMGKVSDTLFVSTGHYRNGILLSPIVGKLIAQAIQGDSEALRELQPFSPQIRQK